MKVGGVTPCLAIALATADATLLARAAGTLRPGQPLDPRATKPAVNRRAGGRSGDGPSPVALPGCHPRPPSRFPPSAFKTVVFMPETIHHFHPPARYSVTRPEISKRSAGVPCRATASPAAGKSDRWIGPVIIQTPRKPSIYAPLRGAYHYPQLSQRFLGKARVLRCFRRQESSCFPSASLRTHPRALGRCAGPGPPSRSGRRPENVK